MHKFIMGIVLGVTLTALSLFILINFINTTDTVSADAYVSFFATLLGFIVATSGIMWQINKTRKMHEETIQHQISHNRTQSVATNFTMLKETLDILSANLETIKNNNFSDIKLGTFSDEKVDKLTAFDSQYGINFVIFLAEVRKCSNKGSWGIMQVIIRGKAERTHALLSNELGFLPNHDIYEYYIGEDEALY